MPLAENVLDLAILKSMARDLTALFKLSLVLPKKTFVQNWYDADTVNFAYSFVHPRAVRTERTFL